MKHHLKGEGKQKKILIYLSLISFCQFIIDLAFALHKSFAENYEDTQFYTYVQLKTFVNNRELSTSLSVREV